MAIIFNDTQKAAIVSLLIEMINADQEVHPSECAVFDAICIQYGINDEIYIWAAHSTAWSPSTS